jgi:hypothetical protein
LEEKGKTNGGLKIVIAITIIALLGVICFLLYKLTHLPQPEPQVIVEAPEVPEGNVFDYDTSAVATDEDSLTKALEDMANKAKEGTMTLKMKTTASSSDGINFACALANAPDNRYDMFMTLYLDETGEELYKSGLIPLGMEIDSFQINRQLNPGTYDCTLVYSQVNEDKTTIHSTVNVGLTLSVSE